MGEFRADCGKFDAEMAREIATNKLTLVELDEEEHSLGRLRRWHENHAAATSSGVPAEAEADQPLKHCTEAADRLHRSGVPAPAREVTRAMPGTHEQHRPGVPVSPDVWLFLQINNLAVVMPGLNPVVVGAAITLGGWLLARPLLTTVLDRLERTRIATVFVAGSPAAPGVTGDQNIDAQRGTRSSPAGPGVRRRVLTAFGARRGHRFDAVRALALLRFPR